LNLSKIVLLKFHLIPNHFREHCVNCCKVTRCSVTGKPVGTFSCECGFVYSRRGPDETAEDRFKVGRIKKFGKVWENRLDRLKEEGGMSLREMARVLGVDPKTVKNQFDNTSKDKMEIINQDVTEKQEKILQNRIEWLKLLAQQEETKLSKTALYAWLYRNDKEWLQKNPPIGRRGKCRSRVDWTERDIEMEKRVKRAVEEIHPLSKIRISKNEIGRRVGRLSLLKNQLHKMPIRIIIFI